MLAGVAMGAQGMVCMGSEMTTELATGAAEAWAWACKRKALAGPAH